MNEMDEWYNSMPCDTCKHEIDEWHNSMPGLYCFRCIRSDKPELYWESKEGLK